MSFYAQSKPRVSAGTRVMPHQRQPKKPCLESTIRVVAHGSHVKAISIDGDSPLAYPFWRYRDADRDFHIDKYRKRFYDQIDSGVSVWTDAIEQLIARWQENKTLLLSHDKPELPCHAVVISEYLCYELRRRGLAADFS